MVADVLGEEQNMPRTPPPARLTTTACHHAPPLPHLPAIPTTTAPHATRALLTPPAPTHHHPSTTCHTALGPAHHPHPPHTTATAATPAYMPTSHLPARATSHLLPPTPPQSRGKQNGRAV